MGKGAMKYSGKAQIRSPRLPKMGAAKPKKSTSVYDRLNAAYTQMKKTNGPC